MDETVTAVEENHAFHNELESDDDDPPFMKKLKAQIQEGKGISLNPVKHGKFKKAMLYTDIRLDFVIFLKEYLRVVRNEAGSKIDEELMKDILTLIGTVCSKGNFEALTFFKKANKQLHQELDEDDQEAKIQENYLEFKKHFSEVWSEVMKWKMTPSVHRKVIILLPEKVMLHLSKPLHMSDFLLESFKLGGPVSLVSLHGIFLLMQNFNFEVADFYTRLYSMFTHETLCSKYRARFFAYSREFLSSTHLPESMVASFVKKLSRLSVSSPVPALPMVFDFIINLILQHPGLKALLNPIKADGQPKIKDIKVPDYWGQDFESFLKNKSEVSEVLEDPDPFDENEIDPMKTRAMESWLCEIKTLQNHSISSIALQAKFVSKALPKVERDMEKSLSLTYKDIEEQERQMTHKLEPTPSHIKPTLTWETNDDESNLSENKKAKLCMV